MDRINVRQVDFIVRAILALSIGYSAFISEILRAGIQSIEKEQTEAAATEGASYWQTMRFILLPQAVRNVLPALGNEFIAMLKDLGAGLGVGRAGHHPARQSLFCLHLQVLPNL